MSTHPAIEAGPTPETHTMPADVDAERAVLGALMWDARLHDDLAQVLTGPDFWNPNHEQLWEAITELLAAGQPSDPLTLAAHLEAAGTLDRIGGRVVLADMYGEAIPASALVHARIVHDRAVQRRTLQAAQRITQLASGGVEDVQAMVEAAQATLDQLDPGTRKPTTTAADGLEDLLASIGTTALSGLPTPWPDLNARIGGLQGGRLHVVAARPGVGKSLVGQALAQHWAQAHGQRALVASVEMGAAELRMRMLARVSRVPLQRMREGNLTPGEQRALDKGVAAMVESHHRITICDDPGQSVASIRAEARQMARQPAGLGLVVVDYLQLLTPPATTRRDRNREQEVAASSRELKRLAMELGVPVVALSQLNRASTARADKRPTLADLRESGAIEQDSDVVLLLHQPDPDENPSELDVIAAKVRNGSIGDLRLIQQGWVADVASRQWAPSGAVA